MQKNSSILIGRSFYSVNSFGDFATRAIGKVLKKIRVGGSQAPRRRFSDLVFLLIFHLKMTEIIQLGLPSKGLNNFVKYNLLPYDLNFHFLN